MLSGFELYPRWVPLSTGPEGVTIPVLLKAHFLKKVLD